MIYLLFSVLASTTIFVIFKLFGRFKINILHAIVVNYIMACLSGLIAFDGTIDLPNMLQLDWFYYAIALGALFIIVFNLMALTTQRSGLSVVSVATKMSLIIPIIFGLLYYKEHLGVLKFIGILLALIAVYLASVKEGSRVSIEKNTIVLPLLVFLGSGVIDTSIKFLEDAFVSKNDVPLFSSTIFGAAAILGILVLLVKIFQGKFKLELKNIIAGIALGVPNYFSVFFLVKALRSGLLDSSGIFTINNVLIVVLSTVLGILLFKEKLGRKNWLGIDLALFSLFFFALAHMQ
ncbi:MAG: DMT family transporter [Bacteroidota bacterium]